MNRYDTYKPTGIKWIGEIPEHWGIKKLKYVGDALIGITYSPDDVSDEENGVLVLRSSNIQNGKLDFEDCVFVNKEIKEKDFVKAGDILLCARNGSVHLVGKCAIIKEENTNATFGAFMSVFRSSVGEFAYQFFNSQIFKSQTGLFSTSTINQLTSDTLNNLFVPLPPQEELITIANYLDQKTVQIDKLIANKQQLIELLKEERTAIINEAIRGEGKNWERKKLKYVVTKVGSGVTPSGGASVYQTEGIPLLRSQNVYDDGLRMDDVAYISPEIDEEMSNSRIMDNDVLLNITGASIGRSFYIPSGFGNGNVNQHVCIIRPDKSVIETKFLHFILISDYGQNLVNYCQNGANREGLNFQQIKNFELSIPPIIEQKTTIKFIEERGQKIDSTISKIRIEIKLIQEYRTALISEVVTGKIKVI